MKRLSEFGVIIKDIMTFKTSLGDKITFQFIGNYVYIFKNGKEFASIYGITDDKQLKNAQFKNEDKLIQLLLDIIFEEQKIKRIE